MGHGSHVQICMFTWQRAVRIRGASSFTKAKRNDTLLCVDLEDNKKLFCCCGGKVLPGNRRCSSHYPWTAAATARRYLATVTPPVAYWHLRRLLRSGELSCPQSSSLHIQCLVCYFSISCSFFPVVVFDPMHNWQL